MNTDTAGIYTLSYLSGSQGEIENSFLNHIGYGVTEGIEIINMQYFNFSNNTVVRNRFGLILDNADYVTIESNVFNSSSGWGIYLITNSDYAKIINNTVDGNESFGGDTDVGINLFQSSHAIIENNTFYWISTEAIYTSVSNNNTIRFNTANDSQFGILNQGNNTVIANNILYRNDRGIALGNLGAPVFNTTVENNIIYDHTSYGIHSRGGLLNNNITINNNYVKNASRGIDLELTNNSVIANNIVINNSIAGIRILTASWNNTVYNNNISGNTNNVQDSGLVNYWNITKISATNIIGGINIGGNFYSNYTGNDTDGDGIGETSFNITGTANSIDYLPLVASAQPSGVIPGSSPPAICTNPIGSDPSNELSECFWDSRICKWVCVPAMTPTAITIRFYKSLVEILGPVIKWLLLNPIMAGIISLLIVIMLIILEKLLNIRQRFWLFITKRRKKKEESKT